MNPKVETLVLAIVSFVNERGGGITKTKLLKLLYLFDIEYFRLHGKIFTGLDWKFFHLGPWTSQFDPVLAELVQSGAVVQEPLHLPEFDVAVLHAARPVELSEALDDVKDEIQLNRILMDWTTRSTGELLDYVYFRTEPMEHAIRNERLDFSFVSQEQAPKYKRVSSETQPGTILRKKREFQQRLAEMNDRAPAKETVTPAKYDDQFLAALDTLDRLRNS